MPACRCELPNGSAENLPQLAERLFALFTRPEFLGMEGLANEVPIFVQAYAPAFEDQVRRDVVKALVNRLAAAGIVARPVDLFSLVLDELDGVGLLQTLIDEETSYDRRDLFETLRNYSDPKKRLVPRLAAHMQQEGTQLTFITGSGRVFPFLRTHTILESLQPQMVGHPVVIFFPGDYVQEPGGGSNLRLFGTIPSPTIVNPYYRAINLDTYRM